MLKKNDQVNVVNGDSFMTLPNGSTDIQLLEEGLRLNVGARDAYGNISNKTEVLKIR